MATTDLTSTIAPFLDRHLVFPLLEFLQDRQLFPENDILVAKIDLLGKTNMVDYAMDIHKSLYQTDEVPAGMKTIPFIPFLLATRGCSIQGCPQYLFSTVTTTTSIPQLLALSLLRNLSSSPCDASDSTSVLTVWQRWLSDEPRWWPGSSH